MDIDALRRHALSMGGLYHTRVRKKVWPKLVGANMYAIRPYEGVPLNNHKDRAQVLLDVNRCIRRIPARKYIHAYCILLTFISVCVFLSLSLSHPLSLSLPLLTPDYSESRKKETQEQLLRVILRLLSENEELHYYQGFHDIVITFLLVGGEDMAYAIMSVLVKYHIR